MFEGDRDQSQPTSSVPKRTEESHSRISTLVQPRKIRLNTARVVKRMHAFRDHDLKSSEGNGRMMEMTNYLRAGYAVT